MRDRDVEADRAASLQRLEIGSEVPYYAVPVLGCRQHVPRVARPTVRRETG